MKKKWYICIFWFFGDLLLSVVFNSSHYTLWTSFFFIPLYCTPMLFILMMNKSLVSSLLNDFTVVYSIFNYLIYVICVTLIDLQRTDGNMEHIIFAVLYAFIFFITNGSMFLYDAFQPDFVTPRFRAFLFGVGTIFLTMALISRYFNKNTENFQIHIFSFALNIESMATSALSAITIFGFKNFIFSLLQPNNFIMLTTSLRHRNIVNAPITCICCGCCNRNDIEAAK